MKLTQIRHARRLLSSLILKYIDNQITSDQLKTLTFALNSFANMVKLDEFESRIKQIEDTISAKKNMKNTVSNNN
jgi:ribosomal protein L12E/L44/L45/RPP1/RPP2